MRRFDATSMLLDNANIVHLFGHRARGRPLRLFTLCSASAFARWPFPIKAMFRCITAKGSGQTIGIAFEAGVAVYATSKHGIFGLTVLVR